MDPRERLILALDVDSADGAAHLVSLLHEYVGAFKVGLELVNACGVGLFGRLADAGARRVFYDAKLHDIPNTVAGAVRACARHRLWMVNVHAAGGSRMMRAAAEALAGGGSGADGAAPLLIGVTLLTSLSSDELAGELHVSMPATDYVVALAQMAQSQGLDGVVASPHEASAVRAACGPGFLIVTPGVRPAGSATGDQRRVATPARALRDGADFLVIGRAVTAAPDPADAARRILDEVAAERPAD